MDVTLDKRYDIAASLGQSWTVLSDIRATAACMPGASITEQVDETHYNGVVKSKVGPASMTFGGEIEVQGLAPELRQIQLLGKGKDKSGSSASMQLTASLEAGDTPESCVLVGNAVITVNGKLAQMGGRLLMPVADMMLKQFAKNFETTAAAIQVQTGQTDDASSSVTAQPETAVDSPQPDPVAAAPAQATELNALALGWGLIKSWFGGLFGKR